MVKMVMAALVAASVAGVSYAGEGCGAGAKSSCSYKSSDKQASSGQSASYGTIDPAALKSMLDAQAKVVLVDARSAKWDDGKRIPGAISLTSDASEADIATALPNKDAAIVTYCSSEKCPASATLAERLTALGYGNVVKYPQGIEAWINAGNVVSEQVAKSDG